MPRFFFHFDTPGHPGSDLCGVELPDLDAAEDWAVSALKDLKDPIAPLGIDPMEGVLTIADEFDTPLKRITAKEVLSH